SQKAGTMQKWRALCTFAAFAPDAGQSITDISAVFPKPLGLDKLVPQPDGFLLPAPEGSAVTL
ncbi:MAG TPA: alpha/beta hydrolase, partial [Candidatus Binatia bacterium]